MGDIEMIITPPPGSNPQALFEKLPTEIRLDIYRYLLLPEAPLYLYSDKGPDKASQSSGTDVDDEWVDMDTDSYDSDASDQESFSWLDQYVNTDGEIEYNGMSLDTMDQLLENDLLDEEGVRVYEALERRDERDERDESDEMSDSSSSSTDSTSPRDIEPGRELAILRVNRQIHQESSGLFHAEITIMIEMEDIFYLARNPPILEDGDYGFSYQRLWTTHPLINPYLPVTRQRFGGRRKVVKPRGGRLDPMILARFRKVEFQAHFADDYVQDLKKNKFWIDDDTLAVSARDANAFTAHVKTLPVIKDFVKLMSIFSEIQSLTISLGIFIEAESTCLLEDLESSDDDELYEVMIQREEKVDKVMDAAGNKALELLIDSGIFMPLLELSNVRTIDFELAENCSGALFKLTEAHTQEVAYTKQAIERNFKA